MSGSEPSKMSGQTDSVIGSAKEMVGNAIGSSGLTKSGKEQHVGGESEVKAAKAKGWTEGAVDTAKGKVDNITGAVTGDDTKQASGKLQDTQGKVQREMNQ